MTDFMAIAEKLANLTPNEQDDLKKGVAEATKGLVFVPASGPQMDAYFSRADVLLYGGSPGGGKTALEVGLALNEHHRSLIVRKSFVDLAGVLHTLDNILGTENSYVGGNRPVYRKPNGGVIDFMGMGDDLGGKQGNPHDLICVGKQTPVLMADGSYRPAETVQRGDLVATLEGPRRVLNAFATPLKPSIIVTAGGVAQVQSATHKLLTVSGWHPCETSSPRECRGARNTFAASSRTFPGSFPLRVLRSVSLQLLAAARRLARPTRLTGSSACAAHTGTPGLGSACAASGGRHRQGPLRLLSSGWMQALQLLHRATAYAARTLRHSACACGTSGAQKTSALRDFLARYSAGSRLCGEHTPGPQDRLTGPEDGRGGLLLLCDAGRQTPSGSPADGAGRAPTHTRHRWSYAHPYTGDIRQSNLAMVESAYSVLPVGDIELFDLEVEGVNHFITMGGFVNKNCVDEAAQLPEDQVRMLMGWLRTDKPGQRCRMVLGSNPPLDTVGDWLIGFFAPWLDPRHPNPAQEGELRYFLPDENGHDKECSADDYIIMHGIKVPAQSRTFISSKFTDNPYYDQEQYAKSLAGLPMAAREILVSGSFLAERQDDIWQAIPTGWVKDAQNRWNKVPPVGVPMCAIGVDVAQGGSDNTVLAIRHDGWYAPLIVIPGKDTPDGKAVSGHVIKYRRNQAKVIVDMGGGWGGDAFGHLRENGIETSAYMGVKASLKRTSDRQHKFFNVRSEAYWKFREALDPSQPQGSPIMLPHDPVLVADLCAPTYEITPNGIKIESKEKVVERLGRSPDRGDAVVMAWWDGLKQANIQGGWKEQNMGRRVPQVIMRK